MAGEKCHSGEFDQTIVQCSDGLHVQVVGGLIEDQTVCTTDHHLGKKAAYLLATGENFHLLHTILAGKQHTSQEASYIGDILYGRVPG